MAASTRTEFQRKQDLSTTAQLYLARKTQTEIAAVIGVSQRQISYDLKAIEKEWFESSMVDLDERKAEELARLDAVEAECWAAWERSKQNKERRSVTRTQEKIEPTDKRRKEAEERGENAEAVIMADKTTSTSSQEGQVGDGRFLDGVLRCVNMRMTILGIDAPPRKEIEDPPDHSTSEVDLESWSDGDLQVALRLVQSISA